jgi:microcystin-dependent protein
MAVYPQSVLSPDPLWLQTKSYDARSLRKPFSDLLSPGVEDAASYAVSINSGLQLSIAGGTAYVLGQNVADQGMYRQYITAAVLVTCQAHHATLPRLDQVILRIMDNTHDSSTFNEARIEIVPGTATSGATLANRNGATNLTTLGEASKSVLLLFDVLVPATSGAVTLRDKRTQARIQSQGSIPAGTSIDYNGTGTPAGGFLPEDGSAVSRFTYNELFTNIGTVWGAGDANTTFNVPDKRGRVSVGLGTHTDHNTVGKTDAAAVGNRRVKHMHTVNDPGHAHTLNMSNAPNTGQVYPDGYSANVQVSAPTSTNATGITVGLQTLVPDADAPAYATVAKWVKY